MVVILYFRWNKSGQKWPKVVQNGFKWPNMAQNDPKWPKQLKWPKDAQSCPKWPKVAQTLREYLDGPKWPKILASHHSPKNSKNTFFWTPCIYSLKLWWWYYTSDETKEPPPYRRRVPFERRMRRYRGKRYWKEQLWCVSTFELKINLRMKKRASTFQLKINSRLKEQAHTFEILDFCSGPVYKKSN